MPIVCNRLKGDGTDTIGVEDIITVTGYIEKSQYTAELTVVGFAANCELVSWNDKGVDMPDVTDKPATNNPNATDKPENTDTLQIDTEEFDDTTDSGSAYILAFDNNGTKRFFNGKTESGGVANRLITTANLEEAVIVRLQPVSGGYALCFMNGARKTYIRIYERDAINGKGSLELVSAVPDEVLTFDSTFDTLVYKSSSANSYYLGTYSTYTTLSVYNLSALNQGNVGVSYYPARLYDRGEVASGKPTVPTEPSTPAESTIPTEATTPAESTTPTESTIPTPPSTPTEPATQTTPTVPPVSTTPTTPTESTKPSTPTEPTTPTIPSAPTIPSSPTEPSSPTYPSEDNVNTVPTEPSVPAPEATPSVAVPVAVFSFPDGTPGEHDDGDNVGYEGHVYTSGSYSLTFTEYSKAYFGGYDQLGNGFVKFGSSSAVGSVTFVVPDDVTKVELHLAKYKAKTSKCSINGGAEITLSKSCNNGEYDVVMVDTSVNKTIRISTTSDAPRMVMYAIVYYS